MLSVHVCIVVPLPLTRAGGKAASSTRVLSDVEDAGKRALMLWRGPLVKVGKEGKEDRGLLMKGGERDSSGNGLYV